MARILLAYLLVLLCTAGHRALGDSAKEFLLPEPKEMFRSDAGSVELWAPDFEQLKTADMQAGLVTLESGGLALPKYLDNPQLVYILEGSARVGLHTPFGCPANVRRVNRGDVVAIPRGWVTWWHNDGKDKVRIFGVVETSEGPIPHEATPFFLAGAQKEKVGGILYGFDRDILARAWDVDRKTVDKVVESQDKTGIIKMSEAPNSLSEDENRGANSGMFADFKYSLDESEPMVHVENGGFLWALNRDKFPILKYIRLGVVRAQLHPGALMAPHWLTNGAAIIYVTKGRGRFQMTFNDGRQAVDQDLREGSLVVIPQGYPHTIWANSDEPAEFIAFTNTARPWYAFLAGRTAAYNYMPTDVLAAALNIKKDEARSLKEKGHATWAIIPSEKSHFRKVDGGKLGKYMDDFTAALESKLEDTLEQYM